MNVQGSTRWDGLYRMGECTLGMQTFLIIKLEQSQITQDKAASKGKMLLKAK